jgi:phage tail tape-measure protein
LVRILLFSPLGLLVSQFNLDRRDKMSKQGSLSSFFALLLATALIAGCSGGSLTTREKGAGIGAIGGAAAGGLIGATVGHPGAGAAIGGGLGLGAGALIGDYIQGQEKQQQQQIQRNQSDIERQRIEAERLRKQQNEY